MTRTNISLRVRLLAVLLLAAIIGSCARLPDTGVTAFRPKNLADLERFLLTGRPDVAQFRLRGPFEVTTRTHVELAVSSSEHVVADLYLAQAPEKAPLVILLHGHENSKDDHAYQGLHLASWGLHTLVISLPNHGPWLSNGKALARLAAAIQRRPELLGPRVDAERIVLAGHSFGAAAVAIALADGAPASGGVLLDPAFTGKELGPYLGRIGRPVMLVGADEYVTQTRGRANFFRLIKSGVAEVSIRNAAHEDAQFPLVPPPKPDTELAASEEQQITFVSALTAAAFSLGFTGRLDYAWNSFDPAIESGRLFNPRKK